MTFTQLEYVLAVDEYRNFHRASKSCHVTQPTLSMQLQKLEQELDLILFDRSKNPIIPTEEGRIFIEKAKELIKGYRSLKSLSESLKDEYSGELRLGVIPTLSSTVIPLFLSKFSKKYPDVKLKIGEYKTEDIISMLLDDKLDAGVLVTPLHHEKILERVLFYEEFHVFADKKHPFLKKKSIKQEDLNFDDLWLLSEGHCFRDQVLNICSSKAKEKKGFEFESGSLETLRKMVTFSGGYTFLPAMMVDELSSSQKKQIRSVVSPVPYREVSLVTSRLFYKEKIVEALENTIVENLPKTVRSPKTEVKNIIEIYES